MALECLADSRANCFATADLTLMRSLRKNAVFNDENTVRGIGREPARNRILGLYITYNGANGDRQRKMPGKPDIQA